MGNDPGPGVESPQVDEVELFDAERGEIRVYPDAQLLGSLGGDKGSIPVLGADFGREQRTFRSLCQRVGDPTVDVAVGGGGVDVVDARSEDLV